VVQQGISKTRGDAVCLSFDGHDLKIRRNDDASMGGWQQKKSPCVDE
jgi:hypothetical protein